MSQEGRIQHLINCELQWKKNSIVEHEYKEVTVVISLRGADLPGPDNNWPMDVVPGSCRESTGSPSRLSSSRNVPQAEAC